MVRPMMFVVTLATALGAQRDVGVARDEVVYMGAGDGYARWWIDVVHGKAGATSAKGITAAWGGPGATDHNREHPPLMKTLFGLSHKLLHDGLGVSHVTAYRAPSALMHAFLILIVFAWAVAAWGLAEAVIAGLTDERFLILPHEEVGRYAAHNGTDRERWMAGMRKLQASLEG